MIEEGAFPLKKGHRQGNRYQSGLLFIAQCPVPNAIGEKILKGHDPGLVQVNTPDDDCVQPLSRKTIALNRITCKINHKWAL